MERSPLTNGDKNECNDKGEDVASTRIIAFAVALGKVVNVREELVLAEGLAKKDKSFSKNPLNL